MKIIRLLYVGPNGEKELNTLFSTGANLSCINYKTAKYLAEAQPLGRTRQLATAFEARYIEVKEVVRLDFYIDGVLLSDEFLVVPGLSEEAIIGAATMQKWRIKLNFDDDRVEVDPKVAKMQLI